MGTELTTPKHHQQTLERSRTKRPPLYHVFLLNDDLTPMDFVVMLLERVFHKNNNQAVEIMLETHHKGRGFCGTFTREVAETKKEQVLTAAREQGHPLRCTMEVEE